MANYTKEQIYNLTLNHLGVSATVQNVNELTPRITALNNNYQLALEQVSKDFDWNFLSAIKQLVPTVEKSPHPKYHYSYDYPNDCIAARAVLEPAEGKHREFNVYTNERGHKVILCNTENAILSYTRLLNNKIPESFFSSEFVSALSFYLAFLTADVITGNEKLKQLNYQTYITTLNNAKAMNANESLWEDEDDKTYVDSRY